MAVNTELEKCHLRDVGGCQIRFSPDRFSKDGPSARLIIIPHRSPKHLRPWISGTGSPSDSATAVFAASRNAERFAAALYNFSAPPPTAKTSASLPAPSNRPNAGASMIHNPKLGAPQ